MTVEGESSFYSSIMAKEAYYPLFYFGWALCRPFSEFQQCYLLDSLHGIVRSRSLCSLGNKYGIIAQLFHYPSGDNMIFPPTHSFPIPFDAGEICCTQNNDKIEQRLKQNNVCLLSLTTHHFNPRSTLCAFAILFIPKYLKVEDNKKRKLKNVIREGQTRRNKQEPKKWKCQSGWDGDVKSGQLFSVSQFLFLNNI